MVAVLARKLGQNLCRRKLLLGPGAQTPTLMIMGLAYMTSRHFCDVILPKLCFNCSHWFYAMPTNRQLDHSYPCSARHFWKGAKFAGSVGHPMTKMLSASGGFAPSPLTRGSAPGPCWGLCPQTPVIGSCSALAMVPPNHWPLRRLWSSLLEPPPTYFDKFTPMAVCAYIYVVL